MEETNQKKIEDEYEEEDDESDNEDDDIESESDIDDTEGAEDAEDDDTEEVTDELTTEPLKKKRGRKSKPKNENDEENTEKIQKKRGRKPKVKENETNEKIPKKRGRKPKEKIYSVKELPKTFFEENKNEIFILHLPIKSTERETINEPLPSMSDNSNYSMLIDNDMNDNNNDNMLLTQQTLMTPQQNIMHNFLFDMNKDEKKTPEIFHVKKDDDEEMRPNKIIKKNLRNIMYEFINANNDKTWPDSTNTYCWWCCHPFNGPPCALPELYKKEKFYVSGCFCSFNCTASYNFSKNDDNMWERYSLLNLMYKKLYNNKFVKINMAPPREVLKIFGGYMSIEEFRDNSLRNEKVFTVIKPPLISIIPKIEENVSNTSNKSVKNNTPIVNENILNKTQNNLKLKRNKPITNPNSTLQSFMDLKII